MTLELSTAQCREIKKLRAAAPGVQCVIIGAVAVNHHVALPRSTGDVDLVLALDVEQLQELLQSVGWKQHPRMKQRWTAEELIAAGAISLDGDDKK